MLVPCGATSPAPQAEQLAAPAAAQLFAAQATQEAEVMPPPTFAVPAGQAAKAQVEAPAGEVVLRGQRRHAAAVPPPLGL